ncbi:hypothetical protein ACFL96_03590 [Thermoproteota archaeon]
MNKLNTLEEIATNLGNMFGSSTSTPAQSFDPTGKTAEELKSELDRLSADAKEKVEYFSEEAKRLETLAEKPVDLTSADSIRDMAEIVSDVQTAEVSIYSAEKIMKALSAADAQRQLSEAGFSNYDDVDAQIDELKAQRTVFTEKFLGRFRFKDQIKHLTSGLSELYDFYRNQYETRAEISKPSYSDTDRFEKAQGRIVGGFADALFSHYKSLSEQLAGEATDSEQMTPAIVESLVDDYIAKYFRARMEEKLEEYSGRDDYYLKDAVEALGNPDLVDEALALLKEGLNQNIQPGWNAPDEVKEKVESLKERLDALPSTLSQIIDSGGMNRGGKLANEEFTEFADQLTDIPRDVEKRRVLTSFSHVKQQILHALSDDGLPYSVTRRKWDLEDTARAITRSLQSEEKAKFLTKIDMNKWDTFRYNAQVQELYGTEALESFNQMIKEEVFDKLLMTAEHTDESNNLGYRALRFKDTDIMVYNILNFWREPGYSGEYPFLSVHTNSENTLGAQYITSLTQEQLNAIEGLGIPGVMDVINTVRQHPDTFLRSEFKEGDEYVANPVYEQVDAALGKVCGHYLAKGTEKEKYFVLGVVERLGCMWRSDAAPEQREGLIDALSLRIGLDENVQANFKKHYKHFLSEIRGSSRSSTDLQQYKYGLIAISEYYDNLEALLEKCKHTEKVKEQADSMQNDCNYIHDVSKDLPKLLSYLEAYDSEVIQAQLSDPEYAENFKTRLWNIREKIFRKKTSIDDITDYTITDFKQFRAFIDATNELAQESTVGDVLKAEQARLLDSLVYRDDLAGDTEHIPEYFRALDDGKTSERFAKNNIPGKGRMEWLAKIAYSCHEALVTPLVREALQRDVPDEQLNQVVEYIPQTAEFPGFLDACASEKDNQRMLFDLFYQLSAMGEESLNIVSAINEGTMDINSVLESISSLNKNKLSSTSYLVWELNSVDDKTGTIKEWKDVMDSFGQGHFDSDSELHRNLEYTRFRAIVDHEKVKKHVKNHFTFTDYLSIFERTDETPAQSFTDQDRFEIDCVAEETEVLRDYALSVKQVADALELEAFIVPNLSYGYVPVSPLVEELEQEGINAIIGLKIGSTESHNNKEVVNSRLFKRHRTKMVNEQPIMMIVDGTKHLVSRDDEDKAARYPDAYQGYLNQVIAMNDAMGFTDVDYANFGKSPEDMSNLRLTPEFQRSVDVYKHVLKTDDPQKDRKPYQFGLWNTAGKNLIIRNYHQKISETVPTRPEDIQGPTMIFCNVGLLDEQISPELKQKYEGLTHTPAYFDDSGKIINFDFGFDNFGVRYLNTLETEIKKACGSMHSQSPNGDYVSSLIRYTQNRLAEPVGYESSSLSVTT